MYSNGIYGLCVKYNYCIVFDTLIMTCTLYTSQYRSKTNEIN